MCDHIECHGGGLSITRVHTELHHPPADKPFDPSWVVYDDGWAMEDSGYWWSVQFRTGGFLYSNHRSWQDAFDWAMKYLEMEAGHNGS